MVVEKDLIQAIVELQNGNKEAFAKIYDDTFKYVYSRAKTMFSKEQEVWDLVQEVYVAVYKNIEKLEAPEKIFAWLKTITFYQGTKVLRRKGKDVILSEDKQFLFDEIEDENQNVEEVLEEQDVKIIKECINKLSDEQRLVIIAYYYDDLKVDEIAEMMDISSGTVKSRLYSARKNLKDKIEEEEKKQGYKLHSFGGFTVLAALQSLMKENTSKPKMVYRKLLRNIGREVGCNWKSTLINKVATKLITSINLNKGLVLLGVSSATVIAVAVGCLASGIGRDANRGTTEYSEWQTNLTEESVLGTDEYDEKIECDTEDETENVQVIETEDETESESGLEVGIDNFICIYSYDYKDKNLDIAYRYNDKGFLSDEERYYGDTQMLKGNKILYDDMGNISECIQKFYRWEEEFTDRIVYKYDNENCEKIVERKYSYEIDNNEINFESMLNYPIEVANYEEEKLTDVTRYEYDEHGNTVSGTQIRYLNDEVETENYTFERKYDGNGNIIEEKAYHDGVFYHHYGYEYDENSNKTKEISYSQYGVTLNYYEYKYDEKNNLVEHTTYNKNGNLASTIRYMYDENGNKITKEVTRTSDSLGGDGYWWESYEYDSKGNLTRIITREDGWNSVEVYQYDENDNMIRHISYGKGGVVVSDVYYKWVLHSDYVKNKANYEKEVSALLSGEVIDVELESNNETKILDDKTIEEYARKYYGSFLSHYKNYAANGFNGYAEMINTIYCDYNLDIELYYTIIDLANDGIPELFVSDGQRIYDAYAIYQINAIERQIVPLVEDYGAHLGERVQCEICEDNIIKVRSSGGYMAGEIAYWKLNVAECDLTLIEGVSGNGYNYYYGTIPKEGYGELGYQDEVLVSEEDYIKMDEKYPIQQGLNWCKLSEFSEE